MFVCLYAQFKPAKSAVYKKQRDYLVCKIQHRLSLCDHIHWSPFQYLMKQIKKKKFKKYSFISPLS